MLRYLYWGGAGGRRFIGIGTHLVAVLEELSTLLRIHLSVGYAIQLCLSQSEAKVQHSRFQADNFLLGILNVILLPFQILLGLLNVAQCIHRCHVKRTPRPVHWDPMRWHSSAGLDPSQLRALPTIAVATTPRPTASSPCPNHPSSHTGAQCQCTQHLVIEQIDVVVFVSEALPTTLRGRRRWETSIFVVHHDVIIDIGRRTQSQEPIVLLRSWIDASTGLASIAPSSSTPSLHSPLAIPIPSFIEDDIVVVLRREVIIVDEPRVDIVPGHPGGWARDDVLREGKGAIADDVISDRIAADASASVLARVPIAHRAEVLYHGIVSAPPPPPPTSTTPPSIPSTAVVIVLVPPPVPPLPFLPIAKQVHGVEPSARATEHRPIGRTGGIGIEPEPEKLVVELLYGTGRGGDAGPKGRPGW